MFAVAHPALLTAIGDAERLEVLRSPLTKSTGRMYQPVGQFIDQHGLVLAAQESFEDSGWMYGSVEMSVYVPAASRNVSYALV